MTRRRRPRRGRHDRLRRVGAGVVLAAITASGCGGSTTTVQPPVARAAPATVTATATTTAAAPVYDTHLERDLARSFEDAFFTGPRPATLSQVPPRTDLFVREPATVCEQVHRAEYRCTVTYDVRASSDTQRVVYEVRRRHGCFTAIAVAMPAPRTARRLSSC